MKVAIKKEGDIYTATYVTIDGPKHENFINRKEAVGFRKLKVKAFKKEFAPKADHVIPVGKEPETWMEFGPWLKKMFEGKLAPICRQCHKLKTNAERKERNK